MSFPILFSIEGSHRHELLLISSITSLSDLSNEIVKAQEKSPNTEEFMSKYKKHGNEKIAQIKVRWSEQGRDQKIWPSNTVLTDDNVEAALKMIEVAGVGKDVLEVKLEKAEEEK